MKKLIKKIEWKFDYYVVFLLYNERKTDRYLQYMKDKWESKIID